MSDRNKNGECLLVFWEGLSAGVDRAEVDDVFTWKKLALDDVIIKGGVTFDDVRGMLDLLLIWSIVVTPTTAVVSSGVARRVGVGVDTTCVAEEVAMVAGVGRGVWIGRDAVIRGVGIGFSGVMTTAGLELDAKFPMIVLLYLPQIDNNKINAFHLFVFTFSRNIDVHIISYKQKRKKSLYKI